MRRFYFFYVTTLCGALELVDDQSYYIYIHEIIGNPRFYPRCPLTPGIGEVASLLVPMVWLHAFRKGIKRWAVSGLPDPARSCYVRDFGRGVIRNNRPQTVQHHAYIDIPRVRHGRPGKFPREHLPDHDTKAVDVAGIGASSGIEHLRSTKKDISWHKNV